MWLYALLLTGSFSVPFLLSFDRKLRFREKWNIVVPAILVVAAVFILLDMLYTRLGIW